MSSGQRPRRREFFPHMKVRGQWRAHRRRVHIVLWRNDPETGRLYAPWPQAFAFPGRPPVDLKDCTVTIETRGDKRTLDRWSGRWQSAGTTDDGGTVLLGEPGGGLPGA